MAFILETVGGIWLLMAVATFAMLMHASTHAPIVDPLDQEIRELLARADAVRDQARRVSL